MPVTAEEIFESPEAEYGESSFAEIRYVVEGTEDFDEAHAAVLTAAPDHWNLYGNEMFYLPRQSVACRRIGDKLYEGKVTYSHAPVTDETEYAFDTGGGTQRVLQSLATSPYALPGQTAPNYKGAIGVTKDNVEGVDIVTPVYRFTETHYKDDNFVTPAYKLQLFNLTGKVNSAPFRGFAVGECLFLGAAGRKRARGDWGLTYNFAAVPNVAGLIIGDITDIVKRGWDYLWVLYEDKPDEVACHMVKHPLAVYVEQVYVYADLNLLGI